MQREQMLDKVRIKNEYFIRLLGTETLNPLPNQYDSFYFYQLE